MSNRAPYGLLQNLVAVFAQSVDAVDENACCSPESCCEPAAKADCCEPSTAEGCACR